MVAVKNLAGKCLACTVLFGSSALLAWTLPLSGLGRLQVLRRVTPNSSQFSLAMLRKYLSL